MPDSRFRFLRDSFAFTNETVWSYTTDPATGEQVMRKKSEKPAYSLHCYVVARSALQFFAHARFDPDLPRLPDSDYIPRIRAVVRRPPDQTSPLLKRVVFPGFRSLHDFSQHAEGMLKAHCGGAWQCYLQRGNWRMLLPFTRHHQQHEARRLTARLQAGLPAVIHAGRFPQLTINHALLLFDAQPTPDGCDFATYDPNQPLHPIVLRFEARSRTFFLPRLDYFAGGRVDVYRIYWGWVF